MRKIISYTTTVFILTASLCACRFDGKKHVPKELIPGVEQRAVHVLTPMEIITEGMRQGKLIIDSLQDSLKKQLIHSAQKDSVVYWENLVQKSPLEDSLAQHFNVNISYQDAAHPPKDSVLNNIWEAYQYNTEQKLPSDDNIQQIHGTEHFLFTRAVVLDSSFINKIKAMSTPASKKIGDSLMKSRVHGLLGMWVVKLDKKYVIAHYVVPADKQKL